MSLPTLRYDPLGNGQLVTITLPVELTGLDQRQIPDARRVRTPGGVVASHRGYSYDEVTIEIAELGYSEALEDDMRKFDAFAGQGGEFLFALDDDLAAYATTQTAATPASGQLVIALPVLFGAFATGRKYRIRRMDAARQQVVEANPWTPPQTMTIGVGTLRATYPAGSLVHDLDTYPRVVKTTPGNSVIETPGLKQRFAMTFRTNREIGTP